MKSKRASFVDLILSSALLIFHSSAWASSPESLQTLLRQSLAHSYAVMAQKSQESVAQQKKRVAETADYPIINLEAIDSSGFPASSGALGVSGLMASPFRSGLAYGLSAQETLLDFGRTRAAVEIAEKQIVASRSETEISKWMVEKEVIGLYFSCAQALTLQSLWQEVEKSSVQVENEIAHFIKSGQHSVADGLLVKAQTEQATRYRLTYAEQVLALKQQLAELSGQNASQIECSPLSEADLSGEGPSSSVDPVTGNNAYVQKAKAGVAVAEAELEKAKTGYRPQLNVVGSWGAMQNVRLVPSADTAVGVGLIIPLFDGLKTPREVDQARAVRMQKELEVQAAEQYVTETNLQFDQVLRSDRVELTQLQPELHDSERAYALARERYRDYLGSLADVRESLRNFAHIRSDWIRTLADQARAIHLKNSFNSQEISP